MLESQVQADFIDELEDRYPGCVILKNDEQYQQGIPDLSFFYRRFWAFFEVKAYEGAPERPNQAYFVDMLNEMSFARFVYPENMEEVLYDLQRACRAQR